MKNIEKWIETKFVIKKGKLRASKKIRYVGVSSRIAVDLVAEFYDANLCKYAKGHLLDLGCGKVPLYLAYKNYVDEITCADWGNTLHASSFIDFEADLNEPLRLENNMYDTIILSDVLEHIKEPQNLLNEINRILKKDGHLIMNVPFFYQLHEEPHDYFRYTKHALIYMAEKAGFEVLFIEPLGGTLQIIVSLFSNMVKNIPFLGKIIASFLQNLTLAFTKSKFGRKFSKKTSCQFPFSYGLIALKN